MDWPYQSLHAFEKVLFAARGSILEAFDLKNGRRVSSWSSGTLESADEAILGLGQTQGNDSRLDQALNENLDSSPVQAEEFGPPGKRRKLSDSRHEEGLGKTIGGRKGKRASAGGSGSASLQKASSIICLTGTKDERHLVLVTGDDKTVRVFDHDGAGQITENSHRIVPKRPCAISITPDDSTIIIADKFGDVYSLPVNPSTPADPNDAEPKAVTADPIESTPSERFVPVANHFTVHSARNRKALENQQRQDQKRAEKRDYDPELNLLLGHVSMLTYVVALERDKQSYIVTADRDEHIRISRGIPQAHIIEQFCLGHTEFVTRLCFPAAFPDLLISGGGDDDLFLWDWRSGRILHQLDLQSVVEQYMQTNFPESKDSAEASDSEEPALRKIVVSGIYPLDPADSMGDTGAGLIVTCEGIPALFHLRIVDSTLQHHQTISLGGNALGIAVLLSATETIIVSIDHVHKPGSTSELRTEALEGELLQVYDLVDGAWQPKTTVILETRAGESSTVDHQPPDLSNALYNLENLRKRGGED